MKSFVFACVAVLAVLGSTNAATIAEIATETPELSTLLAAVQAAGLTGTLASNDVNLTVLAPTDDAFTELIQALNTTPEVLLTDQIDAVENILTYHVIDGRVLSTDLTDGQVVETLQGDILTVRIAPDGVYFVPTAGPEAKVLTADVEADNGVVHIIDTVLLPAADAPEAEIAAPMVEVAAPMIEIVSAPEVEIVSAPETE